MQIEENVPLAPLTTIGIGGPARFFFRATTVDEIREALAWARHQSVDVFILGGGSNLLISDDGFDGLVLHAGLRGVDVQSEDRYVMVRVAAGEPWDDFVTRAVESGWAGIECLSGIPGSTGATPIQNVGAYGQEVRETIARVEVLERSTGRVVSLNNSECGFSYRSSIFKGEAKDRYVVLSVTFRLERGGAASVRYPELRNWLESQGDSLDDLRRVRAGVLALRRRKGMVLDPADPDTRSDGSFFMNPVLSGDDYERFVRKARAVVGEEPVIPSFPNSDGSVKLSAAWLIERSGFHKGHIHGRAGLSTKHTLAVINRGGAKAAEVRELVETVQRKVRDVFGVDLHPEPNFIGFSN